VTANGRGALVVDLDRDDNAVASDFQDHLYDTWTAGQEPTRDLLYDAYFGLGTDGGGTWLSGPATATVDPGTGILRLDRSTGDLEITEILFAPMGLDLPATAHLLHVANRGSSTVAPRVFSLANHHLGDGVDGIGSEAIWVDAGSGVLGEWGSSTGLGMVVQALGSPDSFTCDQLWTRAQADGVLDGRCGTEADKWANDDQVGGWQWDLPALAPGEDAWVGTIDGFFSDWKPAAATGPIAAWLAGRSPARLLADEQAWWATWHAADVVPAGASADEQAVYAQSLAYLKMGQVREANAAFGQIPASLPAAQGPGDGSFEHVWDITWVRDTSYAAVALARAGHPQEAALALAFLLQDQAGGYVHLVGGDYGLSVCRLYGDGSEWSDVDATGPNVELDGFGLVLWALQETVAATGDGSLVADRAELVLGGIADVLVATVGSDDLVMADSSIWERHWDGNQQHFAFTQAWAVRGLLAAAELAESLAQPDRADTYRAMAERIRGGICAGIVDGTGLVSASQEQRDRGEPDLDLAAVEVFNTGTLDAAGPQGVASLAAWNSGLAVASGHGFARNDDGDAYDQQEWIWADLRLAEARRRACDTTGAAALEDGVTSQARANFDTLPELLGPDSSDYRGPAPMLGFGAGLYVLTLLDRAEADADCADGVGEVCAVEDSGDTAGDGGATDGGATDTAADTGGSAAKDGCGCGSAGTGSTAWLLGLPLWAAVSRRRRARLQQPTPPPIHR